ncbi:hypothetical protein K2173_004469 [Erythroxylum novogranatense]|uniref:Uncharacterized protein n=1 Tax=Erythroxylum novogranatense TaxID=1862640 RepID=A0AAV8T665_9ROSI|nr:hypothetical protein K2173_004469 [Erythroxylum novogranatense]
MASSLSTSPLVLFSSLLLILPFSSFAHHPPSPNITYHGGPILTGNLNLALIWYGRFGRVSKNAVRNFIKSLNYNAGANIQPQVSSWWKVVECYQEAAAKPVLPINVKVVKQVTDASYSIGKVITADFFKPLIEKATGGDPNIIPIIFTARDVSLHNFCIQSCSGHGVTLGNLANTSFFTPKLNSNADNKLYIWVGNPENECPGTCAWPFHKADSGPVGMVLNPPNGNIGADSMVVSFAQAFAEAVTNPFKTGFFEDALRNPIEIATACKGIFGSGALPGHAGKVLIDPANGGGFNAHGSRGKKFLVPAIWDFKTKTCWTLM